MGIFAARERAALTAGIETAQQMALTAAVTIEVRKEVRQQAAAAALRGLADGLRILAAGGIDPVQSAVAAIAADPSDSGTLECPTCKGRLTWIRDSFNGHLHGQCEADGCLRGL